VTPVLAGLLELRGTVAPDDVFPEGHSDADTLHVTLSASRAACRFRRAPGEAWVPVPLERAVVFGRGRRAVVDARGRVTVRLEGLDAPELHLRGARGLNLRQPYAISAASALHTRLRRLGRGPLPCRVWTAVDSPGEAFDTYGRLVGVIAVLGARAELDVNAWLLAQGWALPSFYTSTPQPQMTAYALLAAAARGARRGLWASGEARRLSLDDALSFPPPHGNPDTRAPVLMPKLFRRAAWGRAATAADVCFLRRLFLRDALAAPPLRLGELVDPEGRVRRRSVELVFAEASSRLSIGGRDAAP
jgi:endonuclease YncB( thermonuclease family)